MVKPKLTPEEYEKLDRAELGYFYGENDERPEGLATYRGYLQGTAKLSPVELLRYEVSERLGGVFYVACDACVTKEAAKLLTHHARGWPRIKQDGKNDPSGYERYEPLKG